MQDKLDDLKSKDGNMQKELDDLMSINRVMQDKIDDLERKYGAIESVKQEHPV